MNHKLIMERWRNFRLNEESPKDAVFAADEKITIKTALWPKRSAKAAAEFALTSPAMRAKKVALGGSSGEQLTKKDLRDLFSIDPSAPMADISLQVTLQSIVADPASVCDEEETASAVLFSILPGQLPGDPDPAQWIGFQQQSEYEKFIKLLQSAARMTGAGQMGIVGQVAAFYPEGGVFDNREFFQVHETGKITVGISPIWDVHAQQQEPTVVLIFGDLGELHGASEVPYFMDPDAALSFAREFALLVQPLLKRNGGSVYQFPSALPVPPALQKHCAEKRHKDEKPPVPSLYSTKLGVNI